jgi:hypothetical protein
MTPEAAPRTWRLFYDDYERGTAFIGVDVDTIVVDDLPYEKAEDIVGAHNAAIEAEAAAGTALDDWVLRDLDTIIGQLRDNGYADWPDWLSRIRAALARHESGSE